MKDMDYTTVAERVITGIKKGAFLTVRAGGDLNTMTIGWATIGYIWRKPVMMVAVRASRHTFGIIERADDFTVSVPSTDMSDAISFCGTRSGRDCDKFKECSLTAAPARHVDSPVVETPGIHLECRIFYKTPMSAAFLNEECRSSIYSDNDFHTLYFGEIKACYET
ncbi:MAG TPA: flavin reductase family protein [Desulfobacteraceae bacterium]|nr:flavin reductase family protein [Desulfobacteraceae bacterium]